MEAEKITVKVDRALLRKVRLRLLKLGIKPSDRSDAVRIALRLWLMGQTKVKGLKLVLSCEAVKWWREGGVEEVRRFVEEQGLETLVNAVAELARRSKDKGAKVGKCAVYVTEGMAEVLEPLAKALAERGILLRPSKLMHLVHKAILQLEKPL